MKVGTNLSISDGVLSATDTTYNNATTSADGLMSYDDKTKLNGIEEDANNYILPTASASELGGVKVGTNSNISLSNTGVISIPQAIDTTSSPSFTDLTLSGNLTVNGTTTTLNTENLDISDSLIGLSKGLTGSPANDAGILINRGSSDNVFIGWDESADKFTMGTTTETSSSTGNLTITTGTLVANLVGDVTGNVTGNLTGTASSVTNGVYTTSSVTALNDVTSVGSGAIITTEERDKLGGIDIEANKYILPTASSTTLGGVKVGNNISLSNTGVISIPQAIGANNNLTFHNLTLTGKITLTGGDITSSTENAFLSGEDSLLNLNGFMYAKAILNYGETGSGTTGVVFGSGSSYGTDEISFITSGDTQMYINDNGVGILNTSPDVALDIGSSDAIRIPRGSTAQRPSTTTVGMIRYNTTTTEYEAWYGGSTTGEWSSLGGTSSVATTSDDGLMSSTDKSKLDGIESGADVTDDTNVLAAGAVMTSEDQTISGSKTFSDLRLNNGDFLRLFTSGSGAADRYSIGMSDTAGGNGNGFSGYTTRFRMMDKASQGFLFTNDSNDCLVSIRASDGLTYINGNTGIGFDPSNALYSSYKLSVNGRAYVDGDVSLNSNLTVAGNAYANTINIGTNNTEFTVDSAGATSIASTLDVAGDTTISGNMAIGKDISNDFALDISGMFRVKSKNGFNTIRVGKSDSNGHYVIIGNELSEDDGTYNWGHDIGNSNDGVRRITNGEFDNIPLHVGSGNSNNNISFRKVADFDADGSNPGNSNFSRFISIITKESILIGGDGLYIYSDKRIKNNIQTIHDNQALLDFRQLNPCTYSYLDKNQRGNKTVYGFIAQEVEEVLPYACRTHSETIPNVYGFATVSVSGKRLTLTMSSFNNLETTDASNNPIPIILKLMNEKKTFYINAETVIDEMNVELNEPLLFEDCVFDNSLNEYVIFIYGQRVDNFKALDKNAIWTVTAAATQEIDRQQQADKVRIAELETKVETLESQLASVLARLTALENA